MLGHLAYLLFLSSAFFFQKYFFKKLNSFRNIVRVSTSLGPDLRPNILSGLIWVQTVCKGCQKAEFTKTIKIMVDPGN